MLHPGGSNGHIRTDKGLFRFPLVPSTAVDGSSLYPVSFLPPPSCPPSPHYQYFSSCPRAYHHLAFHPFIHEHDIVLLMPRMLIQLQLPFVCRKRRPLATKVHEAIKMQDSHDFMVFGVVIVARYCSSSHSRYRGCSMPCIVMIFINLHQSTFHQVLCMCQFVNVSHHSL